MSKVHFNPRVKVRQFQKETGQHQDVQSIRLNNTLQPPALPDLPKVGFSGGTKSDENDEGPMDVTPYIGVIITFLVLGIIMISVWIAGLVRMGRCGGTGTVYFWATLLLFLLVPGPGALAGFIMSIVALVMLKPGKSALGMSCPAKK